MILRRLIPAFLLCSFALPALAEGTVDPEGRIAAAAERIRNAAMESRAGYDALGILCDNFGHRLSGTETLEAAIDWSAETMRNWGFENVRKEPVQVPVWVRNEESLEIIAPAHHDLALLGLGRSVGTGPAGITADVVRVTSFEDLAARPDEAIAGKIVLFDVPFDGYGNTVRYRGSGPSEAARRGAVAALVRSVGPDGMRTPHTGALRYADDAPQIPAAAVSFEDANQIARMLERGDDVTVKLVMGSETLEDRTSHNVVGELPGTDLADEIVVVGGHIDSWDVGQGAQDDGAGCLLSMEAVRLILDLDLRPRRTLRVVLWTNEENGLRGGEAYASRHAADVDRHFAAMESDTGNGLADGFRFDLRAGALGDGATEADLQAARERGKAVLEEVAEWLEPLGSDRIHLSYGGADIGPLAEAGVPALGVNHDTTEYFRIHHTEADTFDRIFLEDFQNNAATMAIMLFALAEMDTSLRP
jgi:carboxypeptidase Q